MRHRKSTALAIGTLGVVLYACGVAATLILPPIVRIVVGMTLVVAGGILVLLGVDILPIVPRNEEED